MIHTTAGFKISSDCETPAVGRHLLDPEVWRIVDFAVREQDYDGDKFGGLNIISILN